jgi:hypothetical protein
VGQASLAREGVIDRRRGGGCGAAGTHPGSGPASGREGTTWPGTASANSGCRADSTLPTAFSADRR